DDRFDAGRSFLRVALAPAAIVELGAALATRCLAHFAELLRARIAVVGLASGQQPLGHLAVAGGPRKLEQRVAIPVETEPGQPIENGRNRRFGGTLTIGILDAQ